MTRVNLLPRAELYLVTALDLCYENRNSQRLPALPTIFRASVPLPPELRERLLGKDTKSPLRLVVGRRWQNLDSFHDLLECGHESSLQFTSFGYIEDQYLHRIPPTAKRRRCQQCKKEKPCFTGDAKFTGTTKTCMDARYAAMTCVPIAEAPDTIRVPTSAAVQTNKTNSTTPISNQATPSNLYDSARAVLNTKPDRKRRAA